MESIIENFRFLVIETENQVKLTYGLLSDFRISVLEKILSKDDYIDNLKATVENACFSRIQILRGHVDQKKINDIRALHIISVNLERIADFCVNIARQTEYLSDIAFFRRYDYHSIFTEIQKGLSPVPRVFDNRGLTGALEICRIESRIDQLYIENFDRIMIELKKGKQVENLVTTIFIFRYLERIGDSLLNIGEALIFAILGDRIKIRQFDALQKTLSESGFEEDLSDIDFSSFWGSRSGCRISKVGRKKKSSYKSQGVFKEGVLRKIKLEQENIRKWERIQPGIAPKIFGYHENQDTASLLVEFLPGCTLDQIILTEDSDTVRNVIFIFEEILGDIWRRTLAPGPFPTDYMTQLNSRLDAVRQVHPGFFRPQQRVGSHRSPSSQDLIRACADLEKGTPAPFSVFIHGDFNANNIVFNREEQKINFIDLHRSRDADYVQDASVFLVSIFRMPVFDPELRERLNTVTLYFYEWFSDFAQANADSTFSFRLALALARSFYTSIRFELNRNFAKEMYLRSLFLLERIYSHQGKPLAEFTLPENILFY